MRRQSGLSTTSWQFYFSPSSESFTNTIYFFHMTYLNHYYHFNSNRLHWVSLESCIGYIYKLCLVSVRHYLLVLCAFRFLPDFLLTFAAISRQLDFCKRLIWCDSHIAHTLASRKLNRENTGQYIFSILNNTHLLNNRVSCSNTGSR